MGGPLFIGFFIGMWLGISILLSYVSGWKELAKYYVYAGQTVPKMKLIHSASMRNVSYRSVLSLGGNAEGLCLEIMFLFAVSSPKLFIPWTDMTIARNENWLDAALEMRFIKVPGIDLRIPGELESFLQGLSGNKLIMAGPQFRRTAVFYGARRILILIATVAVFAAFIFLMPKFH